MGRGMGVVWVLVGGRIGVGVEVGAGTGLSW